MKRNTTNPRNQVHQISCTLQCICGHVLGRGNPEEVHERMRELVRTSASSVSWDPCSATCDLPPVNIIRTTQRQGEGKLTRFQRVNLFSLTRIITTRSLQQGRCTYPSTLRAQLLFPPHHPCETANRIGRNDRRVPLRLPRRIRPPLNRRALQLMEHPVPALAALSPKSHTPISTARAQNQTRNTHRIAVVHELAPRTNAEAHPVVPRRSTSSSPRVSRRDSAAACGFTASSTSPALVHVISRGITRSAGGCSPGSTGILAVQPRPLSAGRPYVQTRWQRRI